MIRTINIDSTTLEVLKEWKKLQLDMLKLSNVTPQKKGQLIFQNISNELIYPTKTEQWLKPARNALSFAQEVKFTAHTFRHTHATTLVIANVPLAIIMHRLGHLDMDTTKSYYLHLNDKSDVTACLAFVKMMNISLE